MSLLWLEDLELIESFWGGARRTGIQPKCVPPLTQFEIDPLSDFMAK